MMLIHFTNQVIVDFNLTVKGSNGRQNLSQIPIQFISSPYMSFPLIYLFFFSDSSLHSYIAGFFSRFVPLIHLIDLHLFTSHRFASLCISLFCVSLHIIVSHIFASHRFASGRFISHRITIALPSHYHRMNIALTSHEHRMNIASHSRRRSWRGKSPLSRPPRAPPPSSMPCTAVCRFGAL